MSITVLDRDTLAAAVWPRATTSLSRGFLLALAGSLLTAVCAQIAVPLWPVPITGQTFAVLLVPLVLGWRLGALSIAMYLAEGALGLPVFAELKGGYAVLLGPTGGYLFGFVAAAIAVGWLAERGVTRSVVLTALAMVVGNAVIYAMGLIWLAHNFELWGVAAINGQGAETAWGAAVNAGLLPFLIGDAIKIVLACLALPAAWRFVDKDRGQRI